jgi:hypothetical protein
MPKSAGCSIPQLLPPLRLSSLQAKAPSSRPGRPSPGFPAAQPSAAEPVLRRDHAPAPPCCAETARKPGNFAAGHPRPRLPAWEQNERDAKPILPQPRGVNNRRRVRNQIPMCSLRPWTCLQVQEYQIWRKHNLEKSCWWTPRRSPFVNGLCAFNGGVTVDQRSDPRRGKADGKLTPPGLRTSATRPLESSPPEPLSAAPWSKYL